jgi:hypothetical protein
VALEVDVAAAELGKTAEELEHIVTRGAKLKTISKKQPKSEVRTPTAAAHVLGFGIAGSTRLATKSARGQQEKVL